mgnify:CR=1 FL=1
MKNIYLVGFMGTGKTTVGKILAKKLNKKFIETDEVIEKKEKKKIVDIFREYGEPYFRRLEKELIKKISKKKDLIVSCGGGLICNEENLKILKETGIVFNLSASVKTIYNRTKNSSSRPLLNVENPKERIRSLLNKRMPFYKQAHYSIKTDKLSKEEVADRIIKILKEKGYET